MVKYPDLSEDEIKVLAAYRRICERAYGDLQISVVHGMLAKLWEVVKNDIKTDRLVESDR